MAKLKAAKAKKGTAKSAKNAIPCLVLLLLIFGGILLLFYLSLRSGS